MNKLLQFCKTPEKETFFQLNTSVQKLLYIYADFALKNRNDYPNIDEKLCQSIIKLHEQESVETTKFYCREKLSFNPTPEKIYKPDLKRLKTFSNFGSDDDYEKEYRRYEKNLKLWKLSNKEMKEKLADFPSKKLKDYNGPVNSPYHTNDSFILKFRRITMAIDKNKNVDDEPGKDIIKYIEKFIGPSRIGTSYRTMFLEAELGKYWSGKISDNCLDASAEYIKKNWKLLAALILYMTSSGPILSVKRGIKIEKPDKEFLRTFDAKLVTSRNWLPDELQKISFSEEFVKTMNIYKNYYLSGNYQAIYDTIENGVKNAPSCEEPIKLLRFSAPKVGLDLRLDKIKPGETYKTPTFISTAYQISGVDYKNLRNLPRGVAESKTCCCVIIIHVPAHYPVLFINEAESEILLPEGTILRRRNDPVGFEWDTEVLHFDAVSKLK